MKPVPQRGGGEAKDEPAASPLPLPSSVPIPPQLPLLAHPDLGPLLLSGLSSVQESQAEHRSLAVSRPQALTLGDPTCGQELRQEAFVSSTCYPGEHIPFLSGG